MSEFDSALANKATKAKKEIIKSRLVPQPLHNKPIVLWQKNERINHFYLGNTNKACAKGGNEKVYGKYFARSPEPKKAPMSPLYSGRIRDFTSQLTVIPGPNNYNQRVEKTKQLPQSKVTEIKKFTQTSYYQEVNVFFY